MTNALVKIALLLILIIFLAACGEKKSMIFVVDFSESVSAEARENAFAAIKRQTALLGRGDSITVIPITSDAQVETGGKVLRLEAGEIRQLRDKDLKEFRAVIETRLKAMLSGAETYKQTDLLGALRVAQEESAALSARGKRVFVFILSDLVHSTSGVRFETAPAFSDSENARSFARKICNGKSNEWRDAEIYLGLLESSDLKKMPETRREAIREFWTEYFKTGGAKRLQFAIDGAGQIDNFLAENPKNRQLIN